MTVVVEKFDLKSKAYCDVINITSQVQNIISTSSLKNGIVNVHVAGSTGAISTVEYEPGLVQTDIKEFLEKIVPYERDYAHHKTWHDYNGAGHLRSFLIKTSQTFPFRNKKLILGSWQNIVFIENDEKPRHREIYITLIGE
ncbi:MAG: secondary thiamine-phosphate synthase enzyme YjbQ [Candidatus Lokiarchaeota archaeon]|nr:secondary thiamine-phosphate synthase enzyme YjbQ [Candidatus Lokiarchaeota archaeon]